MFFNQSYSEISLLSAAAIVGIGIDQKCVAHSIS